MSGANVYRLFDAADRLLYVGCTKGIRKRLNEHRFEKNWFHTVARTTFEEFPTREEALAAELAAILSEAPIHNVRGTEDETMKTCTEADEVQLKVHVPARVRWMVKSQAGLAGQNMCQFVQAAIEEKLARGARLAEGGSNAVASR